jgi:hypothetical protein
LRGGECRARVGPCDGGLIRHLYLRCELVDEVRVGACIDLALEQLRCRLHCEPADVMAQTLARAQRLERDLLLCGGNQPLPFGRRCTLRLLDGLVRALPRPG